MKSKSFKDLIVWQKSVVLAKYIYVSTEKLPENEMYGLTNQMRRSAVSIPSNIAEGSKRGSIKDFNHFLRVASGSVAELETQIILCENIYPRIDFKNALQLLNEIDKMLGTMIRRFSN